jgi:hypothetical protein
MPVIFSAARLKEVMRHSESTVKTPSEMLSRMASVGVSNAGCFLFGRLEAMLDFPEVFNSQALNKLPIEYTPLFKEVQKKSQKAGEKCQTDIIDKDLLRLGKRYPKHAKVI